MPVIQTHCSSVEGTSPPKVLLQMCSHILDILLVMSSVTGNLCNKCPKWLVEQNSSYSDYFNAISGFTSNSRAPGGPVTFYYLAFNSPLPQKNYRCEQDSNLRGESPLDFKSNALTTRPSQLRASSGTGNHSHLKITDPYY